MRRVLPLNLVKMVAAAAQLSYWNDAAHPLPSQSDFDRLAKLVRLFEISPSGWEEIRDEIEPLTAELAYVTAGRRLNDRLFLGYQFRTVPTITEPIGLREPEPTTAADSAARYHGWRESMGLGYLLNVDVRPRGEEPLPLPFVGEGEPVRYRQLIPQWWLLGKGRRRVIDDQTGQLR
jgi:hypothetical protein